MEQPNYYSIIPANVRYDKELKPMEMLMYGELSALANAYGYSFATNKYFAELYGVHKDTVSRWIKNLKDKGYIYVEIIRNDRKEIVQRKIYITPPYRQNNQEGYRQNNQEGIDEKVKGNNTRINNTRENREREPENKIDCITTYQDKIGNINPNTMQKLVAWKDDFDINNQGEEIVSEAIIQSSNENAKSFSYIDNKLKRYLKANVKTLDDAKAQSKENKPNKKQRNNSWLDDELGGN